MPQPKSPPDEWVNVSNHAVTLASGRPLAPGEDPVAIDMKDPHNRALRDEGILVRAETGKTKES